MSSCQFVFLSIVFLSCRLFHVVFHWVIFCQVVFLLGHISVSLSSCQVVFLSGFFPVRLSFCQVVFLSDFSSCQVVFLASYLPVSLSSCQVVFLSGYFPVRWSSYQVVFLSGHLHARWSSCQFIFMPGHLPVGSSFCQVFFLSGFLPVRLSSVILYGLWLGICMVQFKTNFKPNPGKVKLKLISAEAVHQKEAPCFYTSFYVFSSQCILLVYPALTQIECSCLPQNWNQC